MPERATAWLAIRFSASEADVLEERELQNGRTLRLFVYKRVEHVPSLQMKRCPVTPCVPARLD
jgi:hypothetical protein